MIAAGKDLTAVEQNNLVGVFDRSHALGDDNLRRIGNFFLKRLTNEGVRLGIDGGRLVV